MDRFLRQVMLVEIGEVGQARIASATALVGGERLAHEIATRYADGAGFHAVAAGAIDTEALAPPAVVVNPHAREVVAGARAALAEIRRALRDEVSS